MQTTHIIPLLTLLVTILGWFIIARLSAKKEAKAAQAQKRLQVYQDAYLFVVQLSINA